MINYKKSISFQLAADSGLFEWKGCYLRPTQDNDIVERLGHSKEHRKQAYILPANKLGKSAFMCGGSEYTLSELSKNMNIDVSSYENQEKTIHTVGKKQHGKTNIEFSDENLKYWYEHNIENPSEILKVFGIYIAEKITGSARGLCFVIPLSNGSIKYFSLDNKFNVISKLTNFEGKNTIFPSLDFDNSKTVYIVESIADCIKLRELNYNCFCYSGGVNELHKISRFFYNRDAYYIPQMDLPAEKQTNKIMKALLYSGNIPREIKLPINDPIKDVCDFFNTNSHEDLKELENVAIVEKKHIREVAVNYILKRSDMVNIHNFGASRQLKDYYLIYNSKNKMFPIFKNKDGEMTTNLVNFLKESVLPNLNYFIYSENEKIKSANDHFEKFKSIQLKDLLHNKLLTDKIRAFDCELSNLTVFDKEKRELKYSSDINNNVIITQDLTNLQYKDLKPEFNEEIDKMFDELYLDNSIIFKAHIISAIINEDFGQKHLLFISGSSQIGKSKTAELVSMIISNTYSTIDIKTLPSLWQKFFTSRSPVLDNVDIAKNLDPSIMSEIAEIITASRTIKNVRYTQSGGEFVCDVYPIITTINGDLLDRADMQPLKSRSILIDLKYNKYAKDHLNIIYNDKEIIEKARLHFYFLAEQYLKEKIDTTHIDHRSKNFFSVLTFLDERKAREYEKKLKDMENYSAPVTAFLEMLNELEITIQSENGVPETFKLPNIGYSTSDWTRFFHVYTSQKYSEKINERNLFRYYINKFVRGDRIGDYLVEKRRSKKGNYIKFVPENVKINTKQEVTKDSSNHDFLDDPVV